MSGSFYTGAFDGVFTGGFGGSGTFTGTFWGIPIGVGRRILIFLGGFVLPISIFFTFPPGYSRAIKITVIILPT
jgi:hypothetical protein